MNQRFYLTCITVMLISLLPAESQSQVKDQVKDIDGNSYKTVKIGAQFWMTENLRVSHFRNGDPISALEKGAMILGTPNEPFQFVYDYLESNSEIYGRLYNWFAATDKHGITPLGWHVPSEKEWQTLQKYLGGSNIAGGKMKSTDNALWKSKNVGANNSSGFNGIPSGYFAFIFTPIFSKLGLTAAYWSSTEKDADNASSWYLKSESTQLFSSKDPKSVGFSIRCIKD